MNPTTQARIDRIMNGHGTLMKLLEIHRIPIRESIRIALLEQDRDTRHACAEAVAAVYTGERVMSKAEIIHAAHQACMNARAV